MIDTIQNILIALLFILVIQKPQIKVEARRMTKEEFKKLLDQEDEDD